MRRGRGCLLLVILFFLLLLVLLLLVGDFLVLLRCGEGVEALQWALGFRSRDLSQSAFPAARPGPMRGGIHGPRRYREGQRTSPSSSYSSCGSAILV